MSNSRLFRPFAPIHPPILPPLSPLDNFLPQCYPLLPPPSCFAFLDLPPSPSDTCSSISTDISSSPAPDTTHVICDVPLLAPRPLPYHSPTFLQFDLPDTDEDLSHPPYTHRPSKRKRNDDDPAIPEPQSKRRPGIHRRISRLDHRPWGHPSPAHLSHRSGNQRSRA